MYILRGHEVVPEEDVTTWARWLEKANTTIACYEADGVRVSTAFLGLDHNYRGEGPPLLFETMVFGGKHDGCQWRCSTWLEAQDQHMMVVGKVNGLASRSARTARRR